MKLRSVPINRLVTSADLSRSRSSKVFEDHLRSSIDEMGLAEPLKVAEMPSGDFLVIDGVMRLNALQTLREEDETRFTEVPVYVVDRSKRFEIRYQTDIYQDLLPSQLAGLVEHLHQAESIKKTDIARYIGVAPSTVRNYTGLWRLMRRGGLFSKVVEIMDVGVLPASNPYAWLRLTEDGLRLVLETEFTDGKEAEAWIDNRVARARRGDVARYQLKFVEAVTNSLPPECYREGEEVRTLKRELGLRRASRHQSKQTVFDATDAITNLERVSAESTEPVLRLAADALATYLR